MGSHLLNGSRWVERNAEGRNRTDMGLLPLDFESSAYTNFATSARINNDKFLQVSRQVVAETLRANLSFNLLYVVRKSSGMLRVSLIVVRKFASPIHRGRMC